MADYTPTTDEIRDDYVGGITAGQMFPDPDGVGGDFDRWLTQYQAEAGARAVSEMGDWFMQQGFDRDVTAAQACYERAARLRSATPALEVQADTTTNREEPHG